MGLRLGARGLLIAALALGTLPLGAGLVAAPLASAVTTPKVMVVGDSVAHQFDGDYTWRYRLWGEFKRQRKPVDFVGPFRWGYGSAHTYLGTPGWDSDHDAQGATLITDFMDLAPTFFAPNQGRFDIKPTMQKYSPDVLVSVMANNDVNNMLAGGYPSLHDRIRSEGQTPQTQQAVDDGIAPIIANYQAFLETVRSVRPDEKIVVAQVTSQLVEPWVRDRVNAAFATQLTSTPTSPVVIAQTNDPRLARPGYTVDGIHTTPTGDMVIAQRVAEGLHAVAPAVLGVPAVPQIAIPWNPRLRPAIRVSARRIVMNWGVTVRANTVLGLRVKFVNVQTRRTAYTVYTQSSGWTSPTLRYGTYRIRVQGIRGNMTSTWSPVFVEKIVKPKKPRHR